MMVSPQSSAFSQSRRRVEAQNNRERLDVGRKWKPPAKDSALAREVTLG